FIMTVAWSGLHLGRGAATVTSVVSAPVLMWMFAFGSHSDVGAQCALVALPAAALLGEALSWSARRAASLVQLEASRRLRDPLTGLANRTLLSDRLDRSLARARRMGEPLALLFIDLDRFKQVNDSLGHAAGDELLVEAARRLRELAREVDTVARLGGDEFVVVCERSTVAAASRVADRIIAALHEPVRCERGEAHVGATVGIVHTDDGCETAETMLQKADIAMYRAKARGRGCHELFDAEMQQWVARRVELEAALRSAVADDELRLEFQPAVDTSDGRIVGFEALVRWERPGFGLVPPSDFIPYAEESDLIVDIGGWVLHEACRQAARWSDRWPNRRLEIAVNVSSRQIAKGALTQQVDQALAASGLDPTLLTLELTESTLIDDAIGASSALATLRERGIRIAVDDFGTGYSSLTYLRMFPVDVIKIDRSFVDTVGRSREDTAIVAAVLTLANNLGLDVIAEGIETHEQLAALVYLNCRLAQGFLFSRPVRATAVAALVDGPLLGLAAAEERAA
ncbi:MAG TPA: EAL domain-containing protein, partial [Acidimicrobiia bacterium]